MATLEELKDRVLRHLNVIDKSGEFTEEKSIELVVDAIASAHDAILPWNPKKATIVIDSGQTVYQLPESVYEIEAILNPSSGLVIPQFTLEPGQIQHSEYWLDYPTGSITFSEETAADFTLFYLTYWNKPGTADDLTGDFEPSESCMTAMVYYATAYVLLPESVEAGEIRQFNIKADSGNPEHNPLEESVKFLLALFRSEMDSHPRHQKARQ